MTLIQKPGKDPTKHDAYRPICIIDAGSKLLEYLIQGWFKNWWARMG